MFGGHTKLVRWAIGFGEAANQHDAALGSVIADQVGPFGLIKPAGGCRNQVRRLGSRVSWRGSEIVRALSDLSGPSA